MEKISFGTMNWARGRGEGEGEKYGGGGFKIRGCWTQEGRWGRVKVKEKIV